MARTFQPLLFLAARCTRNELIRQIDFLKAENEMLRQRVPQKKIHLSGDEKQRLLKLGEAIGSGVRAILTIVSYGTFLKWRRQAVNNEPAKKKGRPRTAEEVRELIVKLGRENSWGYTRVMGELKKLGIKPPSRTTVKNILKEHGLDPGPNKGPGSWDDFLKRHADTLWQCDFFSKRIWTKFGLKQCFVLVFLHVATRKVFLTPCCRKPDSAWMKRQAEAFVEHAKSEGLKADLLTRDRDGMYTKEFDEVLKAASIRVRKATPRSPNLQAYIERFVQTIKREMLDHVIVFGESHFDYLVSEYRDHYLAERPHQSLENAPLSGDWPQPKDETPAGEVACRERLGGLLKHYYRKAA